MRAKRKRRILICLTLASLSGLQAFATSTDSITIAAASNLGPAIREVAGQFESESGQSVRLSFASTGKLYTQISHGAPFDLFLAADTERPRLLEASGHGVDDSRFTFAIGRLVLWSRDPDLAKGACRAQLENLGRKRLSIANPDTAPYGGAARETLIALDLWEQVQPRLVVGQNVAQALQFAASGNASLGFVADIRSSGGPLPVATCVWNVPEELHRPIEQQAILLKRASGNSAAAAFMNFLRSNAGRNIIERHGYALPARITP